MRASDDLCNAVGDASEMVRQARILAQATSELVGTLKAQAEDQHDSEQQKKLLGAAKMLADATANMVRGCWALFLRGLGEECKYLNVVVETSYHLRFTVATRLNQIICATRLRRD